MRYAVAPVSPIAAISDPRHAIANPVARVAIAVSRGIAVSRRISIAIIIVTVAISRGISVAVIIVTVTVSRGITVAVSRGGNGGTNEGARGKPEAGTTPTAMTPTAMTPTAMAPTTMAPTTMAETASMETKRTSLGGR
jgi:hypothetical protein